MNAVMNIVAVIIGIFLIGLAIVSPVIFIVWMFCKDREKEEQAQEKEEWNRKARLEDLETAERNLTDAEKRNDPDMVMFWANAKEGIEKRKRRNG